MVEKSIVFGLYLCVLGYIGWIGYKRSKNLEDYFLAGRGLGAWVVAISTKASDMSGWLLLGAPGMAYVFGISSFWMLASVCFWDIILWFVVAKRLRNYSGLLKSITIPEFFTDRVKDKSRIIQGVSGLIILFFMTAYVAAQLTAGGKAISASFNLGYTPSLILVVLLTVGYTIAGGFYAVYLTDVVQGLMMIVGLGAAFVVSFIKIGGWTGLINGLAQASTTAQYDLLSVTGGTSGQAFWMGLMISIFLTACYGEPGIPHIVVRFMGAKDSKCLKKSALIGFIWVIGSVSFSLMIGLIARVYTLQLGGLSDPELALPFLATELFNPWFSGFIISAILAATMSTADSQLLVASSALLRDVMEKWLKIRIPENKMMKLSRFTVIIVVILAFVIARIPGAVFFLVAFAASGMGTAFTPLMIASLYWKKLTKAGAVASMLSAFFTCIIWNFTPALQNFIHFQFPAMIVSAVVLVVVSLNTKAPVEAEKELLAVASGKVDEIEFGKEAL